MRPQPRMSQRDGHRGRFWTLAAAVLGTVHAAASFYWAAGGTWLLATVGGFAAEMAQDPSAAELLSIAATGLVKLLAAWAPLLMFAGAGRWSSGRWWTVLRAVCWAGAVGLMLYGFVLHMVFAAIGLTGAFGEPSNPTALWGHLLLWGPLWGFWGLFLLLGLLRSRRASRTAR